MQKTVKIGAIKPINIQIEFCNSCKERQNLAKASSLRPFDLTPCTNCSQKLAEKTKELRAGLQSSTYKIINR